MPTASSRKLSRHRSADSGEQGIHSLEEAMEQLDVHALKFVFLTGSWSLKVIWALLFVAGWVAAGYYIQQVVQEFRSHQTATKVSFFRAVVFVLSLP